MLSLHPIPAFNDNYIWCFYSNTTRQAVVVDPGCAKSVQKFIEGNNLSLEAILLTHHHPDHTGGIATLKSSSSAKVYGYAEARFKDVDYTYSEDDSFELLGTTFKVIEVPGHTLDHIAFYSEADTEHDFPWLFSGDTLFSGGCGRLFEGSAAQMHHSLSKLKNLPGTTLVCCAHEYTMANLAFAKSLMPSNNDLQDYIISCEDKRSQNYPTLPSTIHQEMLINPFFREGDPEIIDSLAIDRTNTVPNSVDVWAQIRQAKDRF